MGFARGNTTASSFHLALQNCYRRLLYTVERFTTAVRLDSVIPDSFDIRVSRDSFVPVDILELADARELIETRELTEALDVTEALLECL